MDDVIMDAKTAKAKSDERFLEINKDLMAEYTKLINDRILESIDKGIPYYESCNSRLHYTGHKYEKISDIVESKFRIAGYKIKKGTYGDFIRWDGKDY